MKKAFSLIEVIFVIVIISLLSGIAVPKVLSIRDNALITKAVHNMNKIINDLSLYYSIHSKVSSDFAKMSNVSLKNGHIFSIGGEDCFSLDLLNTSDDGYLTILKINKKTDNLCNKFFNVGIVKNMISNKTNVSDENKNIYTSPRARMIEIEHNANKMQISLNTNKLVF
ncbi:prepilin-type N-terminal cleavage/methylation domain-containing protein [Campylobacter canadensis]|uniref:Prepilin-type N-terminal cleavage/methylation domain-containing protein n=1 Tax=Campylobacter canadensis TaxID=449520 RepID=A0ABS7WRD1_9BACT|nr:prepilin-type N-terminal cleavage/methylation domain-containing protein [Campylobacter canadensis]MBZ7986644.1 prepilin-type N-terminal cleavage/methylation domain-containing protein [Campylobacter canadensis]MBZ7993951.1 prepilin-type N-terminal cleavage/methylation domain-containing protein [Campylobacter canadensis]MBZ7996267.1 prepilin-type N-terminal cleavage/methylation domain-containing protein [Campylobacter canadensis]MBZ7997680.1 prepilin-type N-terminal cleavage/methylation domain